MKTHYSFLPNDDRQNKRLFYLLVLSFVITLVLMGVSEGQAQQIDNAGLENWDTGIISEPHSFWTSDHYQPLGRVARTTNAHSGQYAARLTVDSLNYGWMFYGFFASGFTPTGWPFTGRPTSLKFWYKYNAVGNDTVQGAVVLTKWVNGNDSIIGTGIVNITSNAATYMQAYAPILYTAAWQPEKIWIFIGYRYHPNPVIGSTFYVDDILLDYSTGISEAPANQTLDLYPNPAARMLTIQMPSQALSDIEITDVTGRCMYRKQISGKEIQVDCGDWANGPYIVKIANGSRTYTRAFSHN